MPVDAQPVDAQPEQAERRSIRLLVVDDHPVVLDGVALLVRPYPEIEVVGSARTAREAVTVARATAPDVVLLDLRLADSLATDVIQQLRQTVPAAKIVIFTAHREHAGIRAVLEAGIDGCLLKDAGGTDLADALHRVVAGQRVYDGRLSNRPTPQLVDRLSKIGLSRREYEVLRLVAMGQTVPEIATALGLTRSTVRTYLQGAIQKLGARNRIEAISRAHEVSLL
jgi:DNA-binding NarL/FixJ family response regulator